MTETKWKTAPISPTCEVLRGKDQFCELPTSYAYPAHGGGWMALCLKHGLKHKHASMIELLIADGETFS